VTKSRRGNKQPFLLCCSAAWNCKRHGGPVLQCSSYLPPTLVIKRLNLRSLLFPGRYWFPRGNCERLQSWHSLPESLCQFDAVRNARGCVLWYKCARNVFRRCLDFRTQLSTTDYGNFLANEPLPLSTSVIADKATQVLVTQFNYLRTNAVEPLSKFLDYIT
jgi:hypothetical protein